MERAYVIAQRIDANARLEAPNVNGTTFLRFSTPIGVEWTASQNTKGKMNQYVVSRVANGEPQLVLVCHNEERVLSQLDDILHEK